ncbi:putative Chromosome-associated kinesin KIF4 [Blattamonas nauphoetae]|uniref:Chromosome-associated kinesin KIF4 n=1 Tax=Blattamonas nauphoetae TaxID=2049346 RepID=A0ABQ9Y3W2_9EUKA|nr:putative Chromosome-associated kinesin KIF4 [Blattamonas nauphoetae]
MFAPLIRPKTPPRSAQTQIEPKTPKGFEYIEQFSVYLRIRPLISDEIVKTSITVHDDHENMTLLTKDSKKDFRFTKIFQNIDNVSFFTNTARNSVRQAFDGENCLIFAYGITGSGKSHTICGSDTQPGIIQQTFTELLDERRNRRPANYHLAVSFVEIYNDQLYDLQNPPKSQSKPVGQTSSQKPRTEPLRIRVTDTDSFAPDASVQMLTSQNCSSILHEAISNRNQFATILNSSSSRSHLICYVYIMKDSNLHSRVVLADLAGSERISVTKQDNVGINSGLLALGRCLTSMANNEAHAPFRDSNLTLLLKPFLTNSLATKKIMIVTISPSGASVEENANVLSYGALAVKITVSSKINTGLVKNRMIELKKETEKKDDNPPTLTSKYHILQEECEALRDKSRSLEEEWMKEKAERIRLQNHMQLFLKELADHFAQREEQARKSAVERMQIAHDENLAKFSSRLIYLQPLGGTHVPQMDHQVQTDFDLVPPFVPEPETVPVLPPDNEVSQLRSTSPDPSNYETMIVDDSVEVRPTTPTSAKGKRLNLMRQLDIINSSSSAPQVEPESIELESQSEPSPIKFEEIKPVKRQRSTRTSNARRSSRSSARSSVKSVSSSMSQPEVNSILDESQNDAPSRPPSRYNTRRSKALMQGFDGLELEETEPPAPPSRRASRTKEEKTAPLPPHPSLPPRPKQSASSAAPLPPKPLPTRGSKRVSVSTAISRSSTTSPLPESTTQEPIVTRRSTRSSTRLQMNVAAENPEEPIVLEDETINPDSPLSRTINILKENLPPMEQTQQPIEDKRQATFQRVPKPTAKRRLLPRTSLSFL